MSNWSVEKLPPQVWAYYHPFYGTPDGPTGRWLTWNEPLWLAKGYGNETFTVPEAVGEKLSHNPDQFLALGRRSNYSAFYPTLGLYDCLDPVTLEQHAHWAVEACLDGLVWDYMLVGEDNSDKNKPLPDTIYDRSFRAMLNVLQNNEIPLELCPWYDSFCWYGYPVEKITEHLAYLVQTYYHHPKVLHINNRIVIYIYSTFSKHSREDWRCIRKIVSQEGLNDLLFLVAGEMIYQKDDFVEPDLFDGFSLYNYGMEDWSAQGVARLSAKLHGVAQRNNTPFWSATVGPGFDGRIWHHPGRSVARGLGKLYEDMWETAIKACPPFITVCSFNEWGEGTQIEPCLEYEDLYLRITAKWAKIFKAERKD
jgi:glycoprotein endo-alpha-1,2-mannosidase